jgi:hypothetical protein
VPRRVQEVCVRCGKNWFACTCGTRFEWEGEPEESSEGETEEEDDLETVGPFDADELGIDPEYEGE